MKTGIECLKNLVDGKSVALIGNASSILDSNMGTVIDDYELIIRMNSGFIIDSESQGTRTDILFTSIPVPIDDIISNFNPSTLVWATSKRKPIPKDYYSQDFNFCLHPLLVWTYLRIKLGSRPSTGAIAANFLSQCCRPSSVATFGFDHFKTKTFYENRDDIGPHSPRGEELFFMKLYKSGLFSNPPRKTN